MSFVAPDITLESTAEAVWRSGSWERSGMKRDDVHGLIERLCLQPPPFGLELPAAVRGPSSAAAQEFASRMFDLADIDQKGTLDYMKFALLWNNLPLAAQEAGGEHLQRFGGNAAHFEFGTRQEWVNGLSANLRAHAKRSVQKELTFNSAGRFRSYFNYIVNERAREKPLCKPDGTPKKDPG